MAWSAPAYTGGVLWQDVPSHLTPVNAADLNTEENAEAAYAAQVGQSVVNHFELSPSGGDDTAAINAAITAGIPLGVGTFLFSGTITGVPRGQGPTLTTIRATNAAAKMQMGPALGSASLQDSGEYGGFNLDGNNIASPVSPLLQINSVDTTFRPILVGNTNAADAVVIAGQNCQFHKLKVGGIPGNGVVWDAGCGGHDFFGPEWIQCGGYHLVIRQTVASPPNGYAIPSENNVWGGILEHNQTTLGGGAGLGCVHQLAGANNYFHNTQFVNENSVPLIYFELSASPVTPTSNNTNGRLYLHNTNFTGGSSAIAAASTVVNGTSALGGDITALLQGDNWFSGTYTVAIPWTNATQVVEDGSHSFAGSVTKLYQASGAAPPAINRKAAVYPEDLFISPASDVTNGITLGSTWQWNLDTGALGGGYTSNGAAGALNDEIDFNRNMSGGNWSIQVTYRKGTAGGQVTVSLDGTTIGTIDCYAASPSNNNRAQFTGVNVPVGGKHTLAFKVTGQTTGSTGFWALLQQIHGRRTA